MQGFRALPFLCLFLPLIGCVTIPDAQQLSADPGKAAPAIEGAAKPLTPAQDRAAFAGLARKPGDDEILQRQVALEGQIEGTPLIAGNCLKLLQNGRPTYDVMEQTILSASTNISLESYIFEDDDIGRSIAGLLIDKAQAGISVQVIYDSEGSIDTPATFWDRMRAAGINVLEYNPLDPLKTRVAYQPNDRDHRKLLIADGKRAVMGGINISDIYLYGGVQSGSMDRWWLGWRDTDIAVEGPVVGELQHFFLDVWSAQKGSALPPIDFFPQTQPAGTSYIRAVPGTPQQGDPQIYVALLSAIRHAQSRVWLTTAFFDPTEEARQVLAEAAKRGVDVELLVPGESDSQVTLAAGRSRYDALLRAGVRIFELRNAFLHGKTATIDGVWSIVGSSNLDARSVVWNNELSAIVLGRDFAAHMEAAFDHDRVGGFAIDRTAWEARPLTDRIEEWSARVFEGLL